MALYRLMRRRVGTALEQNLLSVHNRVMPRWVRHWLLLVASTTVGCGSSDKNPPTCAPGTPACDGSAGAPGAAGAPESEPVSVDPAASAQYRWSECGRIESAVRVESALYTTDESVVTLEASGRVRLFPSGSAVATTLVPALDPTPSIVSGIELSADGRWLLGPSDSAGLGIYAQADQTPIVAGAAPLTLVAKIDPAAESCAGGVTFSADSELIVAVGETACAWSSTSGKLLAKFAVPKLSSIQDTIVSASASGRMTTWNGGQLLHYSLAGELQAQFDAVATSTGLERIWFAQFTPDARYLLVSYSPDASDHSVPPELVTVETETGTEVWRKTLERNAPSLTISLDGTVVLVRGGAAFRISDGAAIGSDPNGFFRQIAALGPGGRRELRLGELVSEWDVTSQKLLRLYGSHTDGIRDLDISRDGHYLASHGRHAVVWQLDDDFARSAPLFDGAAPDDSWNVALAPDGQVLAVSGDNVAFFRRGGTFWGTEAPPPSANLNCLSADWNFSPLGMWTAGTHYADRVELRDTTDFQVRTTLPTSNCGGGVAFSADGSKVVTASLELFETQGWTRLWNAASAGVHSGSDPLGEDAVQFSPDGSELAVTRCGRANEVYCSTERHAAADGQLLGEVAGLLGRRARYSPEGHWLLSENHLLHLPTGMGLELPPGALEALFTPDGDIIAGEGGGSLVRYCRSPK